MCADPVTEIVGAPHMFVSVGSTINLTCLVQHTATLPASLEWRHNGSRLSYSGPRPGTPITHNTPHFYFQSFKTDLAVNCTDKLVETL